jgi:hypothetical protein
VLSTLAVYGANSTYKSAFTLSKITDGMSNTVLLGEGYAKCVGINYIDQSKLYGPGSYYKSKNDSTRVWNDDNLDSTTTSTSTFHASGPYINDTSWTGTRYPYFYPNVSDYKTKKTVPFQVQPSTDNCNADGAQATTAGGLLVCLCDGSVRIVSPSISITTWGATFTPQDGEVLGSDW